ncbi:MAG: hypothetical protein OER97_04735 [Gammaproteobacteria bacterium]|nr:hypothetical protein [Gammaproteobacteria bacterium]
MKNLSNLLFWFGIVSIPISWLAWFYAPEIGREVMSGISDPNLRSVMEEAHRERWGTYVGNWPATLLILSYILEKKAA